MRWWHHPRWLACGAAVVLAAGVWEYRTRYDNVVYFNSEGQQVAQKSQAHFVRKFRRDGDLIHAEDFYYPQKSLYRSAFVTSASQTDKFVPDIQNGELVLWYPDGKKQAVGRYADGKPDGLWQSWHRNGKPAMVVHYRHGLPEGEVTRWYPNGNKLGRLTFVDGKGSGLWQRWDKNGNLSVEMILKDGKVRSFTCWDSKGRLVADMAVENDKQNGVVLTWYDNGDKKSESVFDQDQLVRRTEWDEDGNIVDLE